MLRSIPVLVTVGILTSGICLGGGFSEELEEEMLVLVNQDRAEHDLKPLATDKDLRRVARAHSQDMGFHDFCAHESSDGRTLFDRIYRGGIWASRFAENVARDSSVVTAEEGLMESPGHRENLLDSTFTHVGIGVFCADNGAVYVTQDFIKRIEKVEEEEAERQIFERMNSEREKRGNTQLRVDPKLSILAYKNSFFMWEREDIKILCPGLEGEYSGFVFAFRTTELESIFKNQSLFTTKGERVGIGLMQKESRDYGEAVLWVTIIIAE